jgi:tRNA threonylcarbamoyladenosine biosynthesis protein TsaE
MDSLTVTTHSPDQTRKLGTIIGELAMGSDIYLLSGNLGAGKTHLVQGIAFGLGIKEYACSPSFMIAREYHGRLELYHLDLYRLDHIEEIADLGLDDYFHNNSVCAIEWAEKGSSMLPGDSLTIAMEHAGDDDRRIKVTPHGARYALLVSQLKELIAQEKKNKWS